MRKRIFSLLLAFSIAFSSFLFFGNAVQAQEATPTPTPSESDVTWPQPCQDNHVTGSQCVSYLSNEVSSLQNQENTLSSQINNMNAQINLTQAKIYATEEQITNLTLNIDTASQKINSLASSLTDTTKIFMNRIVATYEVGSIQPVQMLLTSSTVGDFLTRLNYLKIAQQHDQKSLLDMTQAKNDYQDQKNIYEDEKKQVEALKAQLDAYNQQLVQQKAQEQQLLAQTQGSEATYQQLLSQARAQLAALSGFGLSASGGVSILPHQELSDGWGKYFNQRDSNWGNMLINSQSSGCGINNNQPCTIWLVGCLITSYAMVVDHYGGSVTPADIAATSSYFSVGTAEFNSPGPSANGHSATYITNPTTQQLKDALNSGAIIIAGMSMDGGPYPLHYSDHWVVLRGLDNNGDFLINDPEYQGAMNVSINAHYSSWTIIEARIYQ